MGIWDEHVGLEFASVVCKLLAVWMSALQQYSVKPTRGTNIQS